jgi:hypothetical protein
MMMSRIAFLPKKRDFLASSFKVECAPHGELDDCSSQLNDAAKTCVPPCTKIRQTVRASLVSCILAGHMIDLEISVHTKAAT